MFFLSEKCVIPGACDIGDRYRSAGGKSTGATDMADSEKFDSAPRIRGSVFVLPEVYLRILRDCVTNVQVDEKGYTVRMDSGAGGGLSGIKKLADGSSDLRNAD